MYILPLKLETTFHNHTKQCENIVLYIGYMYLDLKFYSRQRWGFFCSPSCPHWLPGPASLLSYECRWMLSWG